MQHIQLTFKVYTCLHTYQHMCTSAVMRPSHLDGGDLPMVMGSSILCMLETDPPPAANKPLLMCTRYDNDFARCSCQPTGQLHDN